MPLFRSHRCRFKRTNNPCCSGTYIENVAVNKEVTLLGANSGTSGNSPGRVSESIIDGDLLSASLQIISDNVVVDGFRIINGLNGLSAGIWMSSSNGGITIENNIITNNMMGIYANCDSTSYIQNNLFDSNNLPGPAGETGIYSEFTMV